VRVTDDSHSDAGLVVSPSTGIGKESPGPNTVYFPADIDIT
jgi:hypothetical protein